MKPIPNQAFTCLLYTSFHRLQLLGIDWTILGRIDGKGTFKEKWTLYHKPEQIIQIIERAI